MTKKPELQDFGLEPEQYALYKGKSRPRHPLEGDWIAFVIPLVVALVVSLVTLDIVGGILWGTVSFLPGIVVAALFFRLLGTIKWNRAKAQLMESPVASQIKLYEDARTDYEMMQKEAERVWQKREKARRESERLRRRAETERLKVERTRRRRLEAHWMSLSGHDFERELATVYRGLGYRVKETPGSGDGGVDLVLKRNGKTIVVQCKAHKDPVGPAIARELYGSMVHSKADRAVLACTGGFTKGVYVFVKGKPIDLVSGSELARLGAQIEGQDIHDTPMCVKCAKAMVLKEGAYGSFWGCPGYPGCRETRDVDEW